VKTIFEVINCNSLFESLPIPIFIITKDITIEDCNPAALRLLNLTDSAAIKHIHSGNVLSCIHTIGHQTCGCSDSCTKCDIRNSLTITFDTKETVTQKQTVIKVHKDHEIRTVNALISTFNLTNDYSVLVIENITDIVEMQKLIPVCSNCKKVRTDSNFWNTIEEYVESTTGHEITHGICPTCITQLYPELTKDQLDQLKDKY